MTEEVKDYDTDDNDEYDEYKRTILHQGYLHKKGQINRQWKKRYFILYNDKKLAYFTNKEVINQPAINEINLSTIKELSLLPYNTNPKKSRARSFADKFTFTPKSNDNNNNDNNNNNNSINTDDLSESEDDNNNNNKNDEYVISDVYVDAPINNKSLCNRKFSFDLVTDKRSYWLNCADINELSEWIIHLKYSIFGKRIIDGYLTKKYKKNLKVKWKKRYIEVYESKIIRIYKNDTKKKVKEQIDLDPKSISYIKYGDDNDGHSFIIEIYDNNCNLQHIFSAETKSLRDEFMNSLYFVMNAQKINVKCEGYLHFRADEVKCWKYAYFALIQGSLIQFRDNDGEKACLNFKNSIYSNDDYYNDAFKKYVQKSMPMIDPQIEKRELNEIDTTNDYKYAASESLLKSLKIFTIKTTIGKWYFGVEEATHFLLWCQSFHKYLISNNKHDGNNKNIQRIFSISDDDRNSDTNNNNNNNNNNSDNNNNDNNSNEDSNGDSDNDANTKAMMAVSLENQSRKSKSQRLHCGASQSVQISNEFLSKLMLNPSQTDTYNDREYSSISTDKDHDDNDGDVDYLDDETDDDEDDIDCLEPTMTENDDDYHLRKHTLTVTNFIIDDE